MNGQAHNNIRESSRSLPFLDNRLSSSDLYRWTFVTDDFLTSCAELELGELLHDDDFGLFEAMSAIELMDPKMDAGMRCNRKSDKPYDFRSAVEAGHVRLDNLKYDEQIAIVDRTFSCLVTWLEGHSLAQTVFTNLYLHQTLEIKDGLLKAHSIAILKLIDIIKDFVARGAVYEEEDFQPLVYGFVLFNNISKLRVAGILREVEDDLQKILRNTKTKRNAEETKENEFAGALFSRIRFLRLLYMGLYHLYKNEIQDGQKCLHSAIDQIPKMLNTISLGVPDEPGSRLIGFEPLANQRLLLPTCIRYTEIRGREPSIQYLKEMIERLLTTTSITSMTSFHSTLDFFIDFGANDPCVLSRSVLQTLYQPLKTFHPVPAGNRQGLAVSSNVASYPSSFQDLLREACKNFIAPPALINNCPPYSGKQIRDCLHSFFSQCCRPMGKFLQTFGHNRARQRDKIAALLEDFSSVQEEADKLDTMLNAVANTNDMLFFSTWLLYHVLRLMIRYLLSGFELELYSMHEYPYLYWYLFELLYPWLTTCLHRADTYLIKQEQLSEAQRIAGKNKKKVKNKRKQYPYAREVTYYQGYSILCAGYFKLLVGLRKENQIMVPNCEFDKGSVRYEHRFAPFANLLTPPLMPYSQYLEVYNHVSQRDSSDIFGGAAKDFANSRKMFETIGSSMSGAPPSPGCGQEMELNKLISLTKNNFVVASILVKDAKRKIDFDFSLHKTFPAVKFV